MVKNSGGSEKDKQVNLSLKNFYQMEETMKQNIYYHISLTLL